MRPSRILIVLLLAVIALFSSGCMIKRDVESRQFHYPYLDHEYSHPFHHHRFKGGRQLRWKSFDYSVGRRNFFNY